MKKDEMSEFDKGFQEGFNAFGDDKKIRRKRDDINPPSTSAAIFLAIIVLVLLIVFGGIIKTFMPGIFDMVRSTILGY